MKKTGILSKEIIGELVESVGNVLFSYGLENDQIIVFKTEMEEILLVYLDDGTKEKHYTYKNRIRNGILLMSLTVDGDRINPFECHEPILDKMVSKMQMKPEYKYKDTNHVTLKIKVSTSGWQCFKNIWPYLRKARKTCIIALIFQLIGFAFDTIAPIYTATLVADISDGLVFEMIVIGSVIFILNVISTFAGRLMKRCYHRMSSKILNDIENDMLVETVNISSSVIEKKGAGTFIQRLTTDTSLLADSIGNIADKGSLLINSLGVLIAVCVVNLDIFLYMVAALVIQFVIELRRSRSTSRKDKFARAKGDGFFAIVGEIIHGSRDVKLLNCEKSMIDKVGNRIVETNESHAVTMLVNDRYIEVRRCICYALNLGLVILLAVFFNKGWLTASLGLVIFNYNSNLTDVPVKFSALVDNLRNFLISNERIFAIRNEYEFPKEHFGTEKLDGPFQGNIELRNVSFAYNHDDLLQREIKVLNNLSMKIEHGQKVAIVGCSGSGKSTVFNLISRLYDPDEGEILYDGKNIKLLDADSIRDNLVVISQTPYIFNMSIRDNLKLVKTDLTDEEMERAIRLAALEEDIKGFEHGYDTILGEGGISLSGGQRQRLAIARGLIKGCRVILLDEATSALDNITQKEVQEAIYSMDDDMTVIMIAHRLSTVVNADMIYFLKDGRIIANGKHKELLEKCEEYKLLYDSEAV